MNIEYKLSSVIERSDSLELVVRFYEGDVTTADEPGETAAMVAITRYRRTRLLKEESYHWPSMTGSEMHRRLRVELSNYITEDRTPLVEQRNA